MSNYKLAATGAQVDTVLSKAPVSLSFTAYSTWAGMTFKNYNSQTSFTATLSSASSTKAGLMTAALYKKLATYPDTYVAPAVPVTTANVSYTTSSAVISFRRSGSTTSVFEAEVQAATNETAGLMTPAMLSSLNAAHRTRICAYLYFKDNRMYVVCPGGEDLSQFTPHLYRRKRRHMGKDTSHGNRARKNGWLDNSRYIENGDMRFLRLMGTNSWVCLPFNAGGFIEWQTANSGAHKFSMIGKKCAIGIHDGDKLVSDLMEFTITALPGGAGYRLSQWRTQ